MQETTTVTPRITTALAFANAIASGAFNLAYSMLSERFKATTSPKQLSEEFYAMIAYANCPPEIAPDVEVVQLPDDGANWAENTGWAYVAMSNDY